MIKCKIGVTDFFFLYYSLPDGVVLIDPEYLKERKGMRKWLNIPYVSKVIKTFIRHLIELLLRALPVGPFLLHCHGLQGVTAALRIGVL